MMTTGEAMEITGRTRLLVLVGDPIHAAKSPQLFNRLFEAQGRDAICIPMQVPAEGLEAFVAGIRTVPNLDGLLVTMPHKARMVGLVDDLHPSARAVGALNVVQRDAHGRWTGAMFDGWGCVLGMRWDGHDPRGRRVFLIGAGGAGSAIAFAVAEAAAAALTIFDVDHVRGKALAEAVRTSVPQCETRFGSSDPAGHDIIINATPLGMRDGDALPIDPALLPDGSIVVDVITQPDPTPLCKAALSRGCRVQGGRAMHEGQAVFATRFFGLDYWPPGRPRIDLPGTFGAAAG
jgi:shikimate dehydrogenase